MKKIIIVSVAGVLSFIGSFLISGVFSPPPAAAPQAAVGPTSAPADEPPVLMGREKELDELVRDMRAKLEQVRHKEDLLDQREKRLAVAQEQIKQQTSELETLRVSLVAPLARLKEARDQLERSRVTVSAQERVNLKRAAAIYEMMDPARGGQILGEMCTSNQENDAVWILYLMSERSAGKVLQEIQDKGLAARLFEKMKRIREQG
ncbi:MAG: hypothetical protein ABFD92_04295 [Planctomycetaceae bacterium]|nr:hypothetical protein [Planctomycetaceae bacterium]